MQRWNQRLSARIYIVAALILSGIAPFVPAQAEATGFQQAYMRLDRMKASTVTGGTVCAQPANAGPTEDHIKITFPTGYTLGSAASFTVTTTPLPPGSAAWTGILTATNVTGQVVTFPSGNLASAATLYCFNYAAAVTTTTAGTNQQASIETQDSGNVRIDYTQIALANISNDQITVTAVVPPSFIFTLSGNADPFLSNLTPAAGTGGVISTAGQTVTVTTNAKGGWIAWAKDQYHGLQSATTGYTIATATSATPTTLTGGTEGYVMDVDATFDASLGCTLASDTAYDGASAQAGGTLETAFQPIASCTGSSPATANGDIITLTERAAISGATPAGSDYTDVITVVGAGNF